MKTKNRRFLFDGLLAVMDGFGRMVSVNQTHIAIAGILPTTASGASAW
jgi:hypothetical protein